MDFCKLPFQLSLVRVLFNYHKVFYLSKYEIFQETSNLLLFFKGGIKVINTILEVMLVWLGRMKYFGTG